MPTPQEKLLERAEIVIGDLTTNGGYLQPAQAQRFIDIVVDTPTILRRARVERMAAPQTKVDKMNFTSRILRAAPQTPGARNLAQSDRAAPTTSKIELNAKEVMGIVPIPYEVLEDNIEQENFADSVIQRMGQQVARDLETLGLLGDTTSSDPYLALLDGWLKRMSVNVMDNASAGISPDMFDNILLTMPQRYLNRQQELVHFVSHANRILYRQKVAQRATGYGDAALTQDIQLYGAGVAIEAANMLTAAEESAFGEYDGPAADIGITTFPSNLIFGIWRNISIETRRDIETRELIIVVTARVDFQIEDVNATVKTINI